MVKIEFLGPIEKEPIFLNATNLKEVSKKLKEDKEISKWLSECAVAINDKLIDSLDVELKDGDKISLLPPVCGG
ncbi:MAG TPA: MoaD/ThiS family protein [Campylobacterales bacterium]|nr:MoaD/ThiS family protein [Campylobacterales bacterium]